jgi:hypothetical protein
MMSCLCWACIPAGRDPGLRSTEPWAVPSGSADRASALGERELLKPRIPGSESEAESVTMTSETDQDGHDPETPPVAPPEARAPQSGAAGEGVERSKQHPARARAGVRDRDWEDHRVRRAALDLAGKHPGVAKVKICYSVREDDWWIILYQEVGSVVELKQFIWKRDQPELEPYLVLERIPKHRLQDHLSRSDPNKACEVLDSAPSAPRASE